MEGTTASLLDAASTGADAAASVLTELVAGRSMCAIARSGESFPAAKYHEGRMAAFGEAARLLSRDGTRSDVERIAASWHERLEHAPLGDWRAYWSGGVDALAELVAIDTEGERVPSIGTVGPDDRAAHDTPPPLRDGVAR